MPLGIGGHGYPGVAALRPVDVGANDLRTVRLSGREIAFRLRVSDRARRCRIQVGPGGIVLVRPRRIPERFAMQMLQEHGAWALAHMDRLAAAQAAGPPEDVILLQGQPVRVCHVPEGSPESGRVELREGTLFIRGPSPVRTRGLLEAWLRARARLCLEASVALHAARMGVKPSAIRIRGQRTRWGSCSRRGGLSFNWRLVMVPAEVLDYVVLHELAHIVHPNHSTDFWMLVHRHCPSYPLHKRWLRRHAGILGTALP